ncbi:T9SS type A sorting domain-containing protein [Pseudopedobacter beijingensis]|uniref:T9SS type A sorting domain-containing protein n=1 Tax=Pseudopedobacter beijingensis TaxID=1207056 RepID=A0ABW4ID67_9SPHI
MKKISTLLFFYLALAIQSKSQIIVTGLMYDPAGYDAETRGWTQTGVNYTNKGGFEYVQLRATQAIDFSTTPYAVIFCRNSSTTTTSLQNGWVAGGDRTVKVNLTSGSVAKGEFFYVGGAEKVIGGYTGSNAGFILSTDISDAVWFPVAYAQFTNDAPTAANAVTNSIVVGDDGIGNSTNGLLHNSMAEPSGVAVFSGTVVDKNTSPIDAIFYCGTGTSGTTTIDASIGINYVYNSTDDWGYKMPDNDWYSSSLLFGQGTNTTAMVRYETTDQSYFMKLGGNYNTQTQQWDIPRSASYVQVAIKTGGPANMKIGTRAMIETNNGVTTLPVELVDFNAKANYNTIQLSWITASEKNNLRFDILKSTDGITFNKIDEIAGHGTTQTPQQYSTVDNNPAKEINYYQLRQVDTDGKTSLSKVIAVKTDLAAATFAVNYTNNNITILFENSKKETPANINLTDITGRSILAFKQNITTGINNISFNVPYLPSGIYVVSLVTENSKHAAKIQVR